tara:strand:- start:1868 stop:2341 length:474 start_codon:yes stop_codon:yes gene_type:complete
MLKNTLYFILIASLVYAANSDDIAIHDDNITTKIIYCPQVNSLTKYELAWFGKSNLIKWKSTEPSLSEDAATFSGAQWDGIQVGSISCVYQSSDVLSFPIVLKNNHMFKQPHNTNWTADNNDTYICRSNNPKDCPLYPKIEQQVEFNIHKIMKQIKP